MPAHASRPPARPVKETAPPVADAAAFDRRGGHLSIDFANTLTARDTDAATEHLDSYASLLAFATESALITAQQARRLQGWERRRPSEIRRVLSEAVELREALQNLFVSVATDGAPERWALEVLNNRLARLRLGEDLCWQWQAGPAAPDAFMSRITRAAAELLTTDLRARVCLCEATDCTWLFLDTSKNGSRRWCDMRECGNRMKARRYRTRHSDGQGSR